jgi:lipid-binding SYLF domain-containing protein
MKTAYFAAIGLFAIVSITFLPSNSRATSAAELEQSARAALRDLYSANPEAKIVANKARAVLVFPRILKAGFMVAAQRGDGVLLVNERVAGYYNTVSASYGFQAGVQKFGYAMFFMNDASLNYLRKSRGWEVGTAPSLVVVDEGIAKSLSTTTLRKGIYVFFFDQRGLMGGLGVQGTKITKYEPSA